MFKDFFWGNVKLKEGGLYRGLLRFDKYAGEIHFKKENEIFAVALPKEIEYIEIDNVRFIFSDYKLTESEVLGGKGGCFVVLIDSYCKLLARKNISIKAAQPSNGITEAKPAKFINKKDSYFIKIGQNTAIGIKNKKNLIAIFGNKEIEITRLISEEKISFKKLKDLKKLVNYYNVITVAN